jgi:putative intracellular protease/amidase
MKTCGRYSRLQGIDVLDITGPFEMFRWANIEVRPVAEAARPIACNGGLTLRVDTGFADALIGEVLWTPGGDPRTLVRLMSDSGRTFLEFPMKQSRDARHVASVCKGALLLGWTGLCDTSDNPEHERSLR